MNCDLRCGLEAEGAVVGCDTRSGSALCKQWRHCPALAWTVGVLRAGSEERGQALQELSAEITSNRFGGLRNQQSDVYQMSFSYALAGMEITPSVW